MKQGKHDAIMVLAQSKLDSIVDIISQAMQGGDITPAEFHKVLQETGKNRKLKADIRNQTRVKVKRSRKNSEKKYLNKEEKKAKKFFHGKSQILQVLRVSIPFKI